MNQAEKERYLREYAQLKAKGKPFFPYAVAKDSVMACIVLFTIIMMSLVLGAELGPKADPTTTTYVPRPEWYFFFLFELLRVVKPPELTPLATIGIPTICMILLVLLPFYDRSPERRPERRPVAMAAGLFVIAAMAYLTYLGAAAGSPNEIEYPVAPEYEAGKLVAANITASGPIAGPFLGDFMRGGAEFNAATLSRFYSIHMLLVPGAIAALIGAHLYLVTKLGTTAPPWLKAEGSDGLREEEV